MKILELVQSTALFQSGEYFSAQTMGEVIGKPSGTVRARLLDMSNQGHCVAVWEGGARKFRKPQKHWIHHRKLA